MSKTPDGKTRIAVLVSGGGTNLQALIDAEKAGKIPDGRIELVIANRTGAYALERASAAGIDAEVVTRKACGGQEGFEARMIELLEERGIELIVLAGFLNILSDSFVRRYDHRIVNIHPSLIPSFCGDGFYGLKPHIAALERGVKVTGATVHFVNEIADGGEIIAQKAVYVEDGDTPEILQRRVMEQAEWVILPEAVAKLSTEIRNGRK
jgi:phosphoribosylglycinamide formyltransferase-1